MIDYIMVCILCVLMIIVNIIVLQSYSLDGKFHLKNVIISLILGFVIAFISIALIKANNKQNEKKIKEWNNGYCTECGEKYRLADIVSTRQGSTHYYYICDNCQKIVERN